MENIRVKEKLKLKRNIKLLLNKTLLTIIIFLIGMIITKQNPNMKELIRYNIYEKIL